MQNHAVEPNPQRLWDKWGQGHSTQKPLSVFTSDTLKKRIGTDKKLKHNFTRISWLRNK